MKKRSNLLLAGIEKGGYKPGKDIAIVLDPAASEFYEDGKYLLKADNQKLSSEEMVGYYENLISKYPDHLHRRRVGRKRLGRLEDIDQTPGEQNSADRG